MDNVNVNIPPRVRFWIYVVTGVGTIAVAYLKAINMIGDAEVTAWAALSVFVNGLAAANTPKEVEK